MNAFAWRSIKSLRTCVAGSGPLARTLEMALAPAVKRTRLAQSGDPSRLYRLNLGSGALKLPGFVSIDADRGASPDLVARIQDIGLFFSPASVREIRMYHSIGYLRLFEARRFFREAYRLLAQDGNLIVECPDAVKCARLLLESGTDESSYLEAVRAFYAFDMTQVERGVPYTSYVFCWSLWHIERELRAAGFRDVTFSDPETHGQRLWRDMRLVATK